MTKLSECLLIVDGLAHDRFLRINGTDYDYSVGANGVRVIKRGGKPHESYLVYGGRCSCPSDLFRGRCKHAAAVELLKPILAENCHAALQPQ